MGVFSRRKPAGKATPQLTENVRKADGTYVQEKIGEFDTVSFNESIDEKSQSSGSDDKKSHVTVRSYSVDPSPIREDSMVAWGVPKGKSRAAIIADLVPDESYEEEEYERSFTSRRKWKSSRLAPGEIYEKPWRDEKVPHRHWEKVIFAAGCLVGCLVGGYLVYDAYVSVTNSEYCMILNDNFTHINEEVWTYEIERGGFGTGSFEWTTDDPSNIYVDESGLHIVPTLTTLTTNITEEQLLSGATLNLTTMGVCTSDVVSDCSIRSNSTSGDIINPVRSARINTQGKLSLRYGKVEVVAKLPKGDWLWPAIWMMPEDSVYGTWPQSGEIDIMEARGNARPFPGGRNQVGSTLHWGPNQNSDAYWRTLGTYTFPRSDFADDFHTFGFEWSEKYMFMYLDSRLLVSSPCERHP